MPFGDEIPWRCRCVIRRENVDDGQLYLHPLRQDGLDVHGYRHAGPQVCARLRETGQVSLPALAEFFTQEEINHLIGILQKPESLKNGAQALHDYSTIILEQAHKRASAGEDPLAAAMEKNKHKGNGGKQPWKKNS